MSRSTGQQHPSGYQTPEALWRAVTDRIRQRVGEDPRLTTSNLQRQFVYDRFLARVFCTGGGGWVLKGGTALLTRVRSARHSRDLDLFRSEGTVDAAAAELREAAAIDLDDHFRFVAELNGIRDERPGRPGTRLAVLNVDAYAGIRRVSRFKVDVVIGSIITTDPEQRRPAPIVTIDGLITPDYLLYPMPDHVADKLCATVEEYGTEGIGSSRVRDLVDLVVIARTQAVDAAALRHAIDAERQHRNLPPITRYTTPPTWSKDYARRAHDVAQCQDHQTYKAALDLVARFLDPILDGRVQAATWRPNELRWESGHGIQPPALPVEPNDGAGSSRV